MKAEIIVTVLFLLAAVSLTGCGTKNTTNPKEHTTITALEAKEMMEEMNDIIVLDVRTKEEYETGHIENAVLLPDTDLSQKAETVLTDKSTTILVYCRSGRRSSLAAKDLVELGYTSVYDFGGILDWGYDIVID